jgi:hypothetical protein
MPSTVITTSHIPSEILTEAKVSASMNWNWSHGTTATVDSTTGQPAKKLRAMIDQATSDSVDESDEHAGLLSMIREEVVCPFRARVEGEEVDCIRFEWPKNGYGLNAVCKAKGKTLVVDIAKVEGIEPLPKGHEWIEAYFAWRDLLN